MATDWYMEGPYVKNCNCDPGCPCDFNQKPTHGDCEGMAAMRIDRGRFGDVDLSGLCWGVLYHWPGPLWEGNGDIQPIIDDTADERQTDALLQAMSGQHGDTFFEIIAFIAPNVKDPIVAPAEFEWDLEERSARVRFGDVLDTVTETLRGIDPPESVPRDHEDPRRHGVHEPRRGGGDRAGDHDHGEGSDPVRSLGRTLVARLRPARSRRGNGRVPADGEARVVVRSCPARSHAMAPQV